MMDEEFNDTTKIDSAMISSTESQDYRFQKEIIYNKLLPYADELPDESQIFLAQIKGNLARAVMLREIYPGCCVWLTRLNKYIRLYGMKFSKEDHILFIKLIYELVIIPELDPIMMTKFIHLLNLLLKKKELINPDELELPWRPLYDKLMQVVHCIQKNFDTCRYSISLDNTVNSLIKYAKIYFPLSATQEILDELRPKLCPFDERLMNRNMKTLTRFLPVQLLPEHHSFGFHLWFDEFMNIWKVCHNAPQWEIDMLNLMAKLAENNIGYIDWEPHVPLMYTRFLRALNLPVNYSYRGEVPWKQSKLDASCMATWMVSVLGGGSNAQVYLEKFLKTIETYYHSANTGKWVFRLKELLSKIPYQFLLRLQKERNKKSTWETSVPESHKLTEADIDTFVKNMMPIAMAGMFSKFCADDAYNSLHYLTTMRPNLVIPWVLERMYSTFDSPTEPHKFIASMFCVASIARPLVQGPRYYNKDYVYSEGPLQVLPLLFSSLPGIDRNDVAKSYVTCRFLSVYASMIPIVDSSRSNAILDDEERLISESTSRFEDLVLQFLDQLFVFIDSSSLEFVRPENSNNHENQPKNRIDSFVQATIGSVIEIILYQTSDAIFNCALHKLRTFVAEKTLETKVAGQLAAMVCKIFAFVNGQETIKALLPLLSTTIFDILEESDIIKEDNLDNRLLYAMLLLSAIVDTPGKNLIPFMDDLEKILDKIKNIKSREGHSLICKFFMGFFNSLISVVPYKIQTHERDFNDPEYPYIRDWGQPVKVDDAKIEWHVPGKEEYEIIQRLFNKYMLPELEKVEKYCENCNSLSRDDLFKTLNIIESIIKGCELALPVWSEPCLAIMESALPYVPFNPRCGINGQIVMPDGSNVRKCLTNIMSNLQKVILQNAEDDTKSLLALAEIWNSLLLNKSVQIDSHESRWRKFQVLKRVSDDKLCPKKGQIMNFILERTDLQHETRIVYQVDVLTETHRRIILELLDLAISRYADVRAVAQSNLSQAFVAFPASYNIVMPKIFKILDSDTEENHDAYKGALFMLLFPSTDPLLIKRDWILIRNLWPKLVLAKISEKLSIIHLRENLVEIVNRLFSTIPINHAIPERCVTAAEAFWDVGLEPSSPRPTSEEVENGLKRLNMYNESNLNAYNGLLKDLLNAMLEKNLHWRPRLMAMMYINCLVHPQQNYPVEIAKYTLQCLIHESIDVRKLALKNLIYILRQQKRIHSKVIVGLSALSKKKIDNLADLKELSPGEREDNLWLQYDHETKPETEEQWNQFNFVHNSHLGYYTWPKEIRVYAPYEQQPTLDPQKRILSLVEREIHNFFDDSENIKKLIKFLSLEEKKGQDKFNIQRYIMFKCLFRNHGNVFVKHFLPHLRHLVSEQIESNQRCAAEITAGLIRGTKHWPFHMILDLWTELLPILRLALSNLTTETVNDWIICITTTQKHRDPNTQHWLLECLLDELQECDFETSFLECGRLQALQTAIGQHSWRVSKYKKRLLTKLEDRILASPFQNVRKRLGSLLSTVFSTDLKFNYSSEDNHVSGIHYFMEKIYPRLKKLEDSSINNGNEKQQPIESIETNNLLETRQNNNLTDEERESTITLFKTVCLLITGSVVNSFGGIFPGFYKLLPILCQFENSEVDIELAKLCSGTLAALARILILPEDMSFVLEQILRLSKFKSWSTRETCLEFMQTFVFHNMAVLASNPSWVDSIRNVVLKLLEDDRLEVRETASLVLGGLLHCKFISDRESLLEKFKLKAKTPLPKLRCNRTKDEEERDKNAKIDAIRLRHAGVLGLCAFIRAHPYDIAPHIPPLFEHLGDHFNDPQPIPCTIRATLGDFKRTHYDGWTGANGHAQQFTEEQLAVLQNLAVPPSYYA